MTKMLPAFEKRPYMCSKRDMNPNWRELNAVKNVSNAAEVECTVADRDRNKSNKSRLHSRSIARNDSLPTIKEPPAPPDLTRTTTPSAAMNDECSQSFGSRNENIRLCIKRWKKISLSRSNTSSNASSVHFEVSITSYNRLESQAKKKLIFPDLLYNLFPRPRDIYLL